MADALDVLSDLMRGGRHCRTTVSRMGVSLPTADRWLKDLLRVPGVRAVREGKTTWFEYRRAPDEELVILRRVGHAVRAFRNLPELGRLTRIRGTKEYSQLGHAFLDWCDLVAEREQRMAKATAPKGERT